MAGNRVEMPHPVPPLAEVSGTVNFNEKGPPQRTCSPALRQGRRHDQRRHRRKRHDFNCRLGLDRRQGHQLLRPDPDRRGRPLARQGHHALCGDDTITPGSGVTVTAQSSLKGVSIALPAPLMKPASANWPMRFSASPITIRQEPGS